MSWRPRGPVRNNPRLDPFRERAGHLTTEAGADLGTVFIRIEPHAQQTGGALWWRRWGPFRDYAHGYQLSADGEFDDFIYPDEVFDEVLPHWSAGRFPDRGQLLLVQWLDDQASAKIREDMFGLPPPETAADD